MNELNIENLAEVYEFLLYESELSKNELYKYKDKIMNLIKQYGINKDSEQLFSLLGLLLNKQELEELVDIEYFKDNEEFFYLLQTTYMELYISSRESGYASKELLKDFVLTLANICDVLGYGVYLNGLITITRASEIDNHEGISLEWYQSNSVFDEEDFGYYDGIENNENHYNELWNILTKELLQEVVTLK
ncbi:MAG: hypothetical protein ACK5LC_03880 [Coprobacillaceae bacterium]